ncbi:MAG: class I SAM-dependent methyltransferase [Candidatus Zixiibacteriota bacterium]|nr:MAG: class I SAM-dependent methyltransferase [candidate division Zixibacteria bacterium]
MRLNVFIIGVIFLAFAICPVAIFGQLDDSLTLPGEIHLNERQPPDTVLKTIGIKPGMIIGEVGAGRGRYTVQIASRIGPSGMIYANDIDQQALKFLEKRCENHGFENVKIILGSVTDPKLPDAALDMVIMVNVVHCLEKPVALLKNIESALKPEGIIVIVEGNLDKYPSESVGWYTRSKLLKIYDDAGYVLFREETFLPKDNIYFLKRGPRQE